MSRPPQSADLSSPASTAPDIARFYQERIGEHGLSYQAVWGDDNANQWKAAERFRIVEPQDIAPGDMLVDLGSGIGLLKAYLDERNIKAEYVAVDIVPEFLSHISGHYGAKAIAGDFYHGFDALPDADWYAIFGSINKKWLLGLEEQAGVESVYAWLARVFTRARKGIYLSCFTDKASAPKDANVHLSPQHLLHTLGDAVGAYRIRHDTPFYEFTLMVRKK